MRQNVSSLALFIALGGIVPGTLAAQAVVIDNGTVQLGINPEGNLVDTSRDIGLTFLPTGGEALAPGCACEGWGVADLSTGAFGMAGEDFGNANIVSSNVVVSGTGTHVDSDGATAIATASVVDDGFQLDVTHDFGLSASDSLYQVDVTLSNVGSEAIGQLVYRRAMDWDVPPTEFSEYVTIQGWPAANLIASSDDGFATGNPNVPLESLSAPLNSNFEDNGPDDHGAAFDFDFGTLAVGSDQDFTIFYGAAASEADALLALGQVNAEVYSLGQPSTADGPTLGTPNTYIFGFAGVGGTPINAAPGQGMGQALGTLGEIANMAANHHLEAGTNRFNALGFGGADAVVSSQGDALMAFNGFRIGVTGIAANGEYEDTANNPGFDYTSRYIGVNADYSLGSVAGFQHAMVGLSFGNDKIKADRSDDLGSFEGNVKSLSLYAAGYNANGLFGDIQIQGSKAEMDQVRIGLLDVYESQVDSDSTAARLRVGYNFGLPSIGSLGFYGEVTRSHTRYDSFSENNAGVSTEGFDVDSNIVGLGTRYTFEQARSNGTVYGYFDLAGYKDTMAKDISVTQTTFGGATYETQLDARDDAFGKVSTMVGMDFNNGWSGRIEGQRIFGGDRSENAVAVSLSMSF